MKSHCLAAPAVLIALALQGCMAGSRADVTTQPTLAAQAKAPKSMRAFQSEREFANYLRELVEKQKRKRPDLMLPYSASAGLPAAKVAAPVGNDKQAESVTNVQHVGVDEGGIVKVQTRFHLTLILATPGTTKCWFPET